MTSYKILLRSYTVWVALGVMLLMSTGCPCPPYCQPTPDATCPASFIQPLGIAPSPPAQKTSIDLSLSGWYIKQRIKPMLEAPERDASGNPTQSGVFIGRIEVKQTSTSSGTANLLTIELEPWLRGQSGDKVSLNNHYVLSLRLRPYVVNATTVPDRSQRARLLCSRDEACAADAKKLVCEQQPLALARCPAAMGCTADEGILLGFEFYALENISQGTTVSDGPGACVKHNLVDDGVLKGLWGCDGALIGVQPFALPTADIVSMVHSLTGQTASATAVALSSGGDLKIGMAFGGFSAHDFTPESDIANSDWSVFIDAGLIKSGMKNTVTEACKHENSHQPFDVLVQSVDSRFGSCGSMLMPLTSIDLLTDGLIPNSTCGNPHLGICSHSELAVCRQPGPNNAPGKSVLMSCTAESNTHFSGTLVQQACIGLTEYVWSALKAFPFGEAYVTTTGPCGVMGELEFEVDKKTGDTFYATELWAAPEGGFGIQGLSSMLEDQRKSQGLQRPSLPPPCSWNYLGKVQDQYGDCNWDYLNRVQCLSH